MLYNKNCVKVISSFTLIFFLYLISPFKVFAGDSYCVALGNGDYLLFYLILLLVLIIFTLYIITIKNRFKTKRILLVFLISGYLVSFILLTVIFDGLLYIFKETYYKSVLFDVFDSINKQINGC